MLPSSEAEDIWPLILNIGMHKPHLPRGCNISTARRQTQNILGRFVADSAKVAQAAAAAVVKPEIWTLVRQGSIVIHGTEPHKVMFLVRRVGTKWHVVPGQIPRQSDEVKVWLRKCVPVGMKDGELEHSMASTVRCLFADVMEKPILAKVEEILPLLARLDSFGFLVRATTLKAPSMLAPPPAFRRNLNAWALSKLMKDNPKTLAKNLEPHFQRMALAFLRNIRAIPAEHLKGKDGALVSSIRKTVSDYTNHEVDEIATEAKAIFK